MANEKDLTFAGKFHINYGMELHGKPFRDNEVAFVYVYENPVDIDNLVLQKEEVDEVKWFGTDEVREDSLINELKMAVNTYGDGNYISSNNVSAFELAFADIGNNLKVLMDSGERDKALQIGKEIIRILESIETDDDYFPYSDIETVCKVVDPFRLDSELCED